MCLLRSVKEQNLEWLVRNMLLYVSVPNLVYDIRDGANHI